MSVDSTILDPATGKRACVLSEGGQLVYPWWVPVEDITRRQVEQRQSWTARLTNSAGSVSLAVDGSVTPQVFSLSADPQELRWIERLTLIFHSSAMDLSKATESKRFGPVGGGLTNGLQFTVHQGDGSSDLFLDPVKVIQEFERYAAIESRGIVNRVDAVATGTDLLIVAVTLPCRMGLFPGSTDSIDLTVADDLTGLDLFEVQITGCREVL
jgi:hypothetical protein